MIPSYSLAQVFGISISEQRKIYFNHRNTLISLLSNTLIVKTHRNILKETQQYEKIPENKDTPFIGWYALFACITASYIGLTIETGVPTVNSLLTASVI
ncbi:hypothetical protein [Arsenophonus sp. ENCA]|nr:hypothetical protein [Arsenophonus sp. ENCA]